VFGPSNTSHQTSHETTNVAQHDTPSRSRRATSGYEDPFGPRPDTSLQSDRRTSLLPDFMRPVSAPVTAPNDITSQWIPPRRELPFPRARLTASSPIPTTKALPSPVETSSARLATSQTFAPASTPQNSPPVPTESKRRVAQRKTTNLRSETKEELNNDTQHRRQAGREPVEDLSPLAAKSAAFGRPSTAPGLRSKATNIASRKRPNDLVIEDAPISKHAKKMVDSATQTQTLSGRDHTAPLSLRPIPERSLSATVSEAHMPPPPPQDYMDELDGFVSKHKNRPPPQEIWQRPGYAEASPEDRQAIINDFICENLDNEDFIKLCEDTAEVWQRIGLEL
jgi:hypothetical protein